MRLHRAAVLIAAWVAACTGAAAQEFQLEDVPAVASVPIAQIKPRTVIFADQRNDKLADSSTGLIPFDDWARSRRVQRRFLSLFPSFVEPTLNQQTTLKLSVYQAEARFRLPRPAAALDLSRYANVAFLEQIDPAVKHRPITAGGAVSPQKAGAPRTSTPHLRSGAGAQASCVQFR